MENLRKRKKIRLSLKTKFKILSLLQDEHKNLAVYTVSKSVNISVIYLSVRKLKRKCGKKLSGMDFLESTQILP